MTKNTLLASEKQFKAIKCFFNDETEDILFGWAARWWKSETIGMILAICLSAFPWSAWLLARTVLADLKATTLNTFYTVIKRFWYDEKSYRDKIRDERHIEFINKSKLYVIQVNLEPADIEFDRIWSYWYTWWFLDEWQQMSNKVREVLSWRLSELDGSFKTEVPMEYKDYTESQIQPWWEVEFKIVWQTVRDAEDCTLKEEDIIEEVLDWWRICYIIRKEKLRIPYKLMKSEVVKNKLIHTYSWNFKGCTFTWCNPWVNFTRSEFYRPWKLGQLPSYMEFIPSKVNDNPWVDQKYIERLERLPDSSIRKQRLLYGNFDFDDSPNILYDTATIEKMFEREYQWDTTPYLIIDAARLWKDGTEIWYWEWLHLKEIMTIPKWDLVSQTNKIETIIAKYAIPINNVLVDEIWVGWGLVDMLWCKWFIWNSTPIHPYSSKLLSYKKRNYQNLRTQAFYYLQKYMSLITISCDNEKKELIIEELLTVKEKDIINDSKLQIVKKQEMKEELWRSPDLADMISMRMYYLIKEHSNWNIADEDTLIPKTQTEIDQEQLLAFLMEEDEEEKKEFDLSIY